jgi:hypothetical protein
MIQNVDAVYTIVWKATGNIALCVNGSRSLEIALRNLLDVDQQELAKSVLMGIGGDLFDILNKGIIITEKNHKIIYLMNKTLIIVQPPILLKK